MAARNAKKQDNISLSFEQATARLKDIIDLLDSSDTELEQSIAFTEEGLTLIRHCRRIIANAEQRIKTLENNIGDITPLDQSHSPEQNETDDEFSLQ